MADYPLRSISHIHLYSTHVAGTGALGCGYDNIQRWLACCPVSELTRRIPRATGRAILVIHAAPNSWIDEDDQWEARSCSVAFSRRSTLDGSSLAERALGHAAALAAAHHNHLLLLRVLTPQPRRGEPLIQEPEARAELQRVADRLGTTGIDVDIEISTTLFGSPAEVIVQTARCHDAETIVMSTHGRSGLGRWLYGSVAEEVLRLAPVPVMLVPAMSERT